MDAADPRLAGPTTERRERLARKGEILYAKSCGAKGRGGCVEGFVVHQIRVGNDEAARDLLGFLEGRLAALARDDSEGLREGTAGLIARVRGLLEGQA